jgi:hypothetical protein
MHGEKKEGRKEERARKKEIGRKYQDLEGVALPSFLSHGRVGWDSFHYYAKPPAKTREAWVYGGCGARGLPSARGPCIPHACERICGVFYDVL